MGNSFIPLLISFLFILKHSLSKTIVVDGLSNWNSSSVHVGDSIIFKYKQSLYSLYIFRNRRAFDLCNFAQATLLDNGSSQSFMWHPSRPGFFYFSSNNGSAGTSCKQGEKASIRVLKKELVEEKTAFPPSAAPSPTPGGGLPSIPTYHWPFHSASVSAPSPSPPPSNPAVYSDGGGGMPFINSNPAVPLPTGETDSATIRPLPISGNGDKVVLWWALQIQTVLLCMDCVIYLWYI
ncbi:uncharacterized protein LOC131237385 [Magnolia sinica]|uniref:uncharacterized protein LOC131237385 n=1 Tax=Magnolia sinica TaxID=86752 RepID=UPI002658546A|nr:uncharacterized protein LOC131237385 [Magnolia sinica]